MSVCRVAPEVANRRVFVGLSQSLIERRHREENGMVVGRGEGGGGAGGQGGVVRKGEVEQ